MKVEIPSSAFEIEGKELSIDLLGELSCIISTLLCIGYDISNSLLSMCKSRSYVSVLHSSLTPYISSTVTLSQNQL